jgi:hypothetical protein
MNAEETPILEDVVDRAMAAAYVVFSGVESVVRHISDIMSWASCGLCPRVVISKT